MIDAKHGQVSAVADATVDLPAALRDSAQIAGLRFGPTGVTLPVELDEYADPALLFRLRTAFHRVLQISPDNALAAAKVEAMAAAILDCVLAEALDRRVSDIHITPGQDRLVVRFRCAGILEDVAHLMPPLDKAMAARIATLIGPLHGGPGAANEARIAYRFANRIIDLGLSSLECADGTRFLIRPVDHGSRTAALDDVAVTVTARRTLRAAIGERTGMIIVTGPAQSARGRLMGAMIAEIAESGRSAIAITDNFDSATPGMSKVVLDDHQGWPPHEALRSVLSQDTDVVALLSETDRLTTQLAMEAAIDRHMIVMRMAVGDAIGAITALRSMRIESFLIASSLRAIVAQRLAPRLCEHCRYPVQAKNSVSARLGFDPGTIVYQAEGCGQCHGSGNAGTVIVQEIIRVDQALKRLINDGGDEAILARHAFLNAPNLGSAARLLVRDGTISAESAVAMSRSAAAVDSTSSVWK